MCTQLPGTRHALRAHCRHLLAFAMHHAGGLQKSAMTTAEPPTFMVTVSADYRLFYTIFMGIIMARRAL